MQHTYWWHVPVAVPLDENGEVCGPIDLADLPSEYNGFTREGDPVEDWELYHVLTEKAEMAVWKALGRDRDQRT